MAHSQGYRWKEISDLPEDVEVFRDRELESLCAVWKEERPRIGEDTAATFSAQLAREWAIETGIIEGVYTLDRGITQTLIERGIESGYIPHDATNRDPELVARIMQAHEEALEGLFAFVKGERSLSTGYIKELHAALLRDVDVVVVSDPNGRLFETLLEKGVYKRLPNNPERRDGAVHEYCPPEHVASEMDRLIELHRQHEARGVYSHVEAAWLHHAFTQIHPFQDGNGRVARALASLVFIKAGFFPLVVTRDDRDRYIDALEAADEGDLSRLVGLFARLQKRSLTQGIGMAIDVTPVESLEQAIVVTREMLGKLGRLVPSEEKRANEIAMNLVEYANDRLGHITDTFQAEIAQSNSDFQFSSWRGGAEFEDVAVLAKKFGYEANASYFNVAAVGSFRVAGALDRITISFHGVGPAFRGLLVGVGYFKRNDGQPVPICEDIFRISYRDSLDEVKPRFHKWLDDALIEGLAQWRRTVV